MANDLQTVASAELVDVDPAELSAIERLAQRFDMFYVEPEDLALSIALRYATAESPEAILTAIETVSGKTFLHTPFELHGLQVTKSALEGGWGYFAMLYAFDPVEAKPFIVTSSALNVVAQAVALVRGGFCPITVQIEQASTPSARGFYPQRLAYAGPEQAF